MLSNYLKTAWRSLLRNKSLTVLNVAGLTMGMTAAVLITGWQAVKAAWKNPVQALRRE